MKKASGVKKLLSVILSAILILSICSVCASAEGYSFTYYYADDTMTDVYISEFTGDVPDDGYVIIPDTINGHSVTGIRANVFADADGIAGVVIPYSIAYIDADAFAGCGNIAILYPDQYEDYKNSFDSEDWYENTAQDYIINGTTLIGYRGNDSVVTIPEGCTAIADGVFKNKKDITTVYLQSNITHIGASAFENCKNLTEIITEKGMGTIEIGANAFRNTPWLSDYDSTYVILGTTLVKYKGEELNISIPNVLTAVADGAFYDCNAESIRIPVTIKLFGGDECFSLSAKEEDYPDILVYEGTAAEEYCENNNIKYEYESLPGDVDRDGDITAADARYVLRVSASLENPDFAAKIAEFADISGDNQITAADARRILRISAQLDSYSTEDLLTMPRSDYEILLAASNAVSYANAYNCGYTKFAYQQITESDMNIRTARNLIMFEDELTSAENAATVVYKRNTDDARNNFFDITLINSDKIEYCTSVIDDEYYTLTITLKDEAAQIDTPSYTQQMFPVETATHYADVLSKKNWVDKFNWNMTYTNCTLEMKVEIATGRISQAILTMNYDFEMSGQTGNTDITNKDGTRPIAHATRTDVIRYTNFVYYN
ncbi:MAG: leucine-rich repeat protein [Clostridia bacterium]|nr:leucine-rich repeat protein [Clostridia bacterium]